jgi:DNA-binding FrmR family transcriptional regulator
VDEVSLMILESHIKGCVASAILEQQGEARIKELMQTLRKAMRK